VLKKFLNDIIHAIKSSDHVRLIIAHVVEFKACLLPRWCSLAHFFQLATSQNLWQFGDLQNKTFLQKLA